MPRRKKRVLILECIPKNEKFNEGVMLKHFLDMIFEHDRERVCSYRVKNKAQLIQYIRNKKDLDKFDFVHFSAHGLPEYAEIELPQGQLAAWELKGFCFDDKTITFSACSTGRIGFAAEVIGFTGAKGMIAPQNDVWFADSALWFLNFYYLVLEKGYSPRTACGRVNKMLKGKVKGGFKFYGWRDVPDLIEELSEDESN